MLIIFPFFCFNIWLPKIFDVRIEPTKPIRKSSVSSFKSKFSASENTEIIEIVNSFQPDYLFIGMTAPKQEKWVYENKHKLNAKVISSIGAVFDFYSGNIKRSHPFWIKYGLEWFPRFLKEPRRLFKRNLVSTPKFILQVLYLKVFNKEFFNNK